MFDPVQPGTRMSSIKGNIAPDGSVALTMTPVVGMGLPGTVTGKMDKNVLVVSVTSARCTFNNIRLLAGPPPGQ